MLLDHLHQTATPGTTSRCGMCDGELRAKCGTIVTWHWAHLAADCDPWAEPESQWHLQWKQHLAANGARIEVPIGNHRADAVLPDGKVIELQSGYLSADQIAAREAHYGDVEWIYRCHWQERLQFGKHGFWWKHGSKAMATHTRPVAWDMGNGDLMQVWLNVKDVMSSYPSPYGDGDLIVTESQRVLGKMYKLPHRELRPQPEQGVLV